MERADLLPETLDLLVLKSVSLGALHGYGVLLRIEQITGGALTIEQGALYPALYRLEHRGLLEAEWGASDNNRRARFYSLTGEGRTRLREETAGWQRFVSAMGAALTTTAGEAS
jgi:transcriptional regulator